ncbi:AcvB/VirJ family lysyl-phosphatidylglycerol hydrolase [uncultured Desulfobulbus sp.]|uniref:AcvB/VirJ family lysyl-phosphatidylglycerol hydrolase n=1 Tax=uncultured Desulfobulbus sp. TaxID=239745 RepID=UPI0029C9ACE6|nr:AcvB/VirJ family lysyl-phosphatidylglycerol hydrolase [uncultured Desulfobulbus sp.]
MHQQSVVVQKCPVLVAFIQSVCLSFLSVCLCCAAAVPCGWAGSNTGVLPSGRDAVADLPLIELPAADSRNDTLAIILSGDGGWADLDKVFGETFQQRGISTVGFDSLKYFWKTRQPAEVSADIDKMTRYYLQAWGKKKVLLVGFSFGACWLPFLVNRLPADILAKIQLCVLLGPSTFVNVEVHVMDWVGDERREGALEVLPEAARISKPVLCVFGKEEDNSICPLLTGETVKTLPMPGGHHYNYKYAAVIEAIFTEMAAVQRR